MGGEDDVGVGDSNAVGEERDESGVGAPALDKAGLGAPGHRSLEELLVARDRQGRPVRREDEPDDDLGAAVECALDGVGDARLPVPHACVDGQRERLLERSARLLRDGVQR